MDLSIENVINISVSEAGQGVGKYNTSNLAIFTRETAEASFGTDGYKIYLEASEVGVDFGTDSLTYGMAVSVFSQNPNILAGGGYLVVIEQGAAETLVTAITRTAPLVQYFGIISTTLLVEADLLLAGATIQALNKIGFFGSRTALDVDPDEMFDLVRQANLTKTRCLYYGTDTDAKLLKYVGAYAGRALSTNFEGSNTTQTMHLKDLAGIVADPTMTQTILNKAMTAGADCYISIQGISKTYTSGANGFFDDVYNLEWFVGALQVAGFNVLAQVGTKIAQTENGVDSIKSAYRTVCESAVNNEFVSAGSWTSPTTFGNQVDFFNNISERGYYIYSLPVALQSQTNREDRIAPLIQIAIKYAGAVHSSSVIVNVNK